MCPFFIKSLYLKVIGVEKKSSTLRRDVINYVTFYMGTLIQWTLTDIKIGY